MLAIIRGYAQAAVTRPAGLSVLPRPIQSEVDVTFAARYVRGKIVSREIVYIDVINPLTYNIESYSWHKSRSLDVKEKVNWKFLIRNFFFFKFNFIKLNIDK